MRGTVGFSSRWPVSQKNQWEHEASRQSPLHPVITFLKGLSDATSTSLADSLPESPKKKAKKRFVKYRPEWELKHPNIRKSSEDVYKVTAAEVTQVYHAVKHLISYRSLDCGFKLSKVIYPDSSLAVKASCGRTKASSITKKVLAPLSLQQAYKDLQGGYFSVCSDPSNKGNIKLYPLLLRHFNFTSGVIYTLLDFYDDDAETTTAIALQITNKLRAWVEIGACRCILWRQRKCQLWPTSLCVSAFEGSK
ncbi:hypothetical protein NDU88_010809 [Pleurodeles waltl]|uniref:Uncharacterized protein n=1 Tax=Pleurodeles waltl TaxID=8319 RepID=A0AAV7S1Q5_PLEWA|nr:hypothetical protein NDU88_010809 [Pleurodeles waltl]